MGYAHTVEQINAAAQFGGQAELLEREDGLVQRGQCFAISEPGLEAARIDFQRPFPGISGLAMGVDIAQRVGQTQQRVNVQGGQHVGAPVDRDRRTDIPGISGRVSDPKHGVAAAAGNAVGVGGRGTGGEQETAGNGEPGRVLFQSFNEGHLDASGSERMTS